MIMWGVDFLKPFSKYFVSSEIAGCKKGMDLCPDTCPLPGADDTFIVRP